jgi:deferrochelatase/peroxidase EfeB
MAAGVDFGDVQGLMRYGYAHMTEACYFLLRVKDASAARAWLSHAPVTSAVKLERPPQAALQLAFTRPGLEALDVPPKVIEGFSSEFISGMAGDENRSTRLGDIGANAPSYWRWGTGEKIPHLLLMLFAEPGLLNDLKQSIQGQFWTAAFEEISCLPTSNMGGREPFGFVDGISQPEIDWDQTRKVPINGSERKYGNIVCLGEFLLGYPNEYGRYTDRPLLDPQDRASSELPPAGDKPDKRDFGRNGTYLVMRQLVQDVREFWQFMDRAVESNTQARNALASSMVGRALADGSPLAPLSPEVIAGIGKSAKDTPQNQFTYDLDADGTHCPFGAHIRRANPRNADIPGAPRGLISTLIRTLGFGNKNVVYDLVASTRFHRILRRGREYGPKLAPEDAIKPAPPDDAERGLHFLVFNANIQRQFEFVQNAWLMRTKFDGLTEESDPLLGNRTPVTGCPFTNTLSIPQNGKVRRRIMDVPQFITVRGGAYFFMPGISALRYLSKIGA